MKPLLFDGDNRQNQNPLWCVGSPGRMMMMVMMVTMMITVFVYCFPLIIFVNITVTYPDLFLLIFTSYYFLPLLANYLAVLPILANYNFLSLILTTYCFLLLSMICYFLLLILPYHSLLPLELPACD